MSAVNAAAANAAAANAAAANAAAANAAAASAAAASAAAANAAAQSPLQGTDPRMKMFDHPEMPTLACFPGSTPDQIVSVEENLFGYEFFGNKFTSAGCASCAKKKPE